MHGLEHGRAANDGGEERLGDTAAKHQLRCLCELRHDVSEDASVLHLSVSGGRDMWLSQVENLSSKHRGRSELGTDSGRSRRKHSDTMLGFPKLGREHCQFPT